MMDMDYRDEYSFITQRFGEDAVKQRLINLHKEVSAELRYIGLEKKVSINMEALKMVLLCYYTDIDRLKTFASIDKVNVAKIFSYTVYWFCRLHPINIKGEKSKENFINERVILHIYIVKILKHMGINEAEYLAYGKFLEICNLMLYNLKYRQYTPQSLEVFFTSLLDCSTMKFMDFVI